MYRRAGAGGVVTAEVFRPPRALGVITGGAFALWAAFIALVAGVAATGAAIGFTAFVAWVALAVFGALALVFAWWTLGLARLSYAVDGEALRIRWCAGEVVVPVADIQRVVPGRTLEEARVDGLNWWGCHVGRGEVAELGPTLFFATHGAPADNLYVVTPARTYALTVSAAREAAFAAACTRRRVAGLEPETLQRVALDRLGALPIWTDWLAWRSLAVALLALGALGGYLFSQYPGLPELVRVDFPQTTGIARVGERAELLRVGAVAGAIVAVNVVLGAFAHAYDRAAGRWLLVSAAALQLVLLAAAAAAFARA